MVESCCSPNVNVTNPLLVHMRCTEVVRSNPPKSFLRRSSGDRGHEALPHHVSTVYPKENPQSRQLSTYWGYGCLMQQSNILINGIMRTGSGVWEVWVVEYGRRISTGEACAGAHRAQESICAGEEELREFDRKLGAFFGRRSADRSVGRARAAQIPALRTSKITMATPRSAKPSVTRIGLTIAFFSLWLRPGIDPGSSPETTTRNSNRVLIYSS